MIEWGPPLTRDKETSHTQFGVLFTSTHIFYFYVALGSS